ncbi:hypothetical protein [Nostoc sp.]
MKPFLFSALLITSSAIAVACQSMIAQNATTLAGQPQQYKFETLAVI